MAGGIAAILVSRLGFKLWQATLAGTVAALALLVAVALDGGSSTEDPWFSIGLMINGLFAAAASFAGAVVARTISSSPADREEP